MKFNHLVLVVSAFSASALMAETLATVGGKAISDADFKKEVELLGEQGEPIKGNPMARKRFMDQLITIKLLEEAGAKEGVEKSKEFSDRMDAIKRQVVAQMYMETMVKKSLAGDAVASHFKKHENRFNGEEVCASHILMPKDKKAEAEKVFADAKKKDADFAALAKAHSTDGSAQQGGDLGCFGRGRMVPEFETAAFATKKGELHAKLVESQFGFHVIKVTDLKPGTAVKLDDVKAQVEADIERSVRNELVDKLKADAKVTVNDSALDSLKF